MSFALRDYQSDLIAQVRGHMRNGVRRILLQSPTGSGKTALTAWMLDAASKNGKRCWFTVHRRELIHQSCNAFSFQGIPYGVIAAGWPQEAQDVQICSIDSLRRRLGQVALPHLMVIDEAHHSCAKSWGSMLAVMPQTYQIGITASPCRLDGRGLKDHFDEMVLGPSVAQLMADGWLSGYRLFAPAQTDLSGVHTLAGDYRQDELAEAVDKPSIIGDAIAHYLKLAQGRRALAFAVNVEHSQHIVDNAMANGIRAMHLDGETPTAIRDGAMAAYRAGKLDFISSCRIFEEGLDVPGIEVIIDCAPTKSLTRVLQRWGRGLRPKPDNQKLIILDHANNTERHGLPDDERDWTLEGAPKRTRKPSEPSVRVCKLCFAANKAQARVCVECGYRWVVEAETPEHAEGELTEIDTLAVRRVLKQEQGKAQSLADLQAIERLRGYRKGWAFHVWQARQRRQAHAS